ncbi:uncharacterized protein LOC122052373 isoform X1 [Zingiber officinale]|uniref:uncharacterized protein LOC122052373 isoform X1 n=1 Tax=Zingiber officinale TaxID=94328 RepID=UPI001C4BDB3C|nr:uncharacterized protein LOC122052373 isoform X1 [Zingiber officinale]
MVLRRSCWSTLEGSVVSTASFSFSNYFPCLLVGTCSPPLFNFSSHGIVMMAGVGLDACCHSAHAGARLKNQIFFFKHVLRRSEILEEGSFKQWKDNWTCVQKPGRLEIGRVPLSRVMLHSLKEQCFFIGNGFKI